LPRPKLGLLLCAESRRRSERNAGSCERSPASRHLGFFGFGSLVSVAAADFSISRLIVVRDGAEHHAIVRDHGLAAPQALVQPPPDPLDIRLARKLIVRHMPSPGCWKDWLRLKTA